MLDLLCQSKAYLPSRINESMKVQIQICQSKFDALKAFLGMNSSKNVYKMFENQDIPNKNKKMRKFQDKMMINLPKYKKPLLEATMGILSHYK